jgi:uncharacterized protein YoxC
LILTRLSDFFRKHEPLTRLLLRIALLIVLASVAWDFHALSLDVSEIAESIDQIQDDVSGLRDDAESSDENSDKSTRL